MKFVVAFVFLAASLAAFLAASLADTTLKSTGAPHRASQ